MGWAVLTDADRVVRKNVNVGKLRQCAKPNGSTAIVGKHHECCARCAKKSVIRDAVEDRAHPMFANAEADVAAAKSVPREVAAILDIIHFRAVEISAAAHQQWNRLRDRLQRFAAGL